MPRRTVLSKSQRLAFETLPVEPDDLVRHYKLSEEDLAAVSKRRRLSNRLGFAVQLCLVRFPGRVLRAGEIPPEAFITFVAEQVGADCFDFHDYARRDQTRREHISLLMSELELSALTQAHFRSLVRWLVPIAVENPKSVFLVGAVLNELRRRSILHPPLAVVERIVAGAEAQADRRVFKLINGDLTDGSRKKLDDWLTVPTGQRQSRLSWVRQPAGRPSPANVIQILERLNAIKAVGLPQNLLEQLPTARRDMLAREGNRVAIPNLRIFTEARRYSVMAVALLDIHNCQVTGGRSHYYA